MISTQVEAAVADRVKGNPFWLRLLLDEWLESDTLVQRSGVWVLTRSRLDDWTHTSSLEMNRARARIARLTDAQRDVLEIVAVCEPITWSLLLGATSAELIDGLVNLGLLAVSGRPATVAFRHALFGEALRQFVPSNRLLGIRSRLNAQVDRAELPLARLTRFVDLDLACGQHVPLADALTVAERALGSDHPSYALEALSAVSSAELDHSVRQAADWQLLHAGALITTDGQQEGLRELGALCERRDLEVEDFTSAHIRKAEVIRGSGDAERADDILTGAFERLDGYPEDLVRDSASRRLAVAQLYTRVRCERYADSMGPLEQLFANPALERKLKVKAGAALAEPARYFGPARRCIRPIWTPTRSTNACCSPASRRSSSFGIQRAVQVIAAPSDIPRATSRSVSDLMASAMSSAATRRAAARPAREFSSAGSTGTESVPDAATGTRPLGDMSVT